MLLEMLHNGYKSTQSVPNVILRLLLLHVEEMEDAGFKGGYAHFDIILAHEKR